MTMNKIFGKLRKVGKGQYKILGFCIFLSVLLMTSFTLMYLGPTVQEILPEGGDTRKMASLLMAVTAVGCSIFTVYASGLFFRYKSREYGVLLALGMKKSVLNKMLFHELAAVTVVSAVLGIVTAVPVSWLLWKFFEVFIVSAKERTYRFGTTGFLAGIGFAMMLAAMLGLSGRRFVKNSDIMNTLKAEHQTETVKEVKPWVFPLGVFLTVTGIFMAIGMPAIAANLFHTNLTSVFNLFYFAALVGVYLILLSVVSQSRLRKNKDRYYKNVVSISMMRFMAKSTTRNMCVIVLLLFAGTFAVFFGLINTDNSIFKNTENSKQFAVHYLVQENQAGREEIYATAGRYSADIKEYGEDTAANLVISYQSRDLIDGRYVTIRNERSKLALFFSASAFENVTGRSTEIPSGSYMTVVPTDYKENIWNFTDGLSEVMNPDTETHMNLNFAGTLEYDSVTQMSNPYAYVLNDQDYDTISEGLSDTYRERVILFNVADLEGAYPFAMDLLAQYVDRATVLSNHYGYYDSWEEMVSLDNGKEYGYAGELDMDINSSQFLDEWKYVPIFKIVMLQDTLQMMAVYLMLCVYIFVIMLAAVGIMTYIRSITVAAENKELFGNLEKLGADREYRRDILKKQLAKIFQYPGILGCGLGLWFSLLMAWFNDYRLIESEIRTLFILCAIDLGIALFLHLIYRVGKKRAEAIAGI